MTRKQKKAKASRSRRRTTRAKHASALLRAMNPGRKFHRGDGMKVKRLKGGGVSIIPLKRKVKAR